ncbi:hypothetical protein [Caldivirga sp. UBA161]|nr:hypothetical protein [Caldivirga sp. UBA161]
MLHSDLSSALNIVKKAIGDAVSAVKKQQSTLPKEQEEGLEI